MRPRTWLLSAALAAAAIAAHSQAKATSAACGDGAGPAVCTVVLKVDEGFRRGDAAEVAAQYSSDAVWINAPGIELRGPEQIKKLLSRVLSSPTITASVDSPLQIHSVQFIRPDVAVVVSYLETTGQLQEGTSKMLPTRKTREMQVLSLHDGKWLIDSDLIADENDNL